MTRWLLGIAFFLAVLVAGVVLRATDYGEATTTTIGGSTTSTATVTSLPSVDTSPIDGTTTTTAPQIPVLEPGADDALVLAQTEAPRVAGVDYEAFPTGADPSDPSGTTYHVAAEGDDEADGSEAQPFATIERALSAAVEGDRVVVHAGAYSSEGLNVTQSRFTLTDAGDGDVIVEASAPDADYALSVSAPGQHDVMVRGLRFVGFERLGIRCGNPVTVARVVLEDLVIDGVEEGLTGYFDLRGTVADSVLVRRVTMRGVRRTGLHFGVGGANNLRIVGLHVLAGGGSADAPTAGEPSTGDAVGVSVQNGDNVVVENTIIEGVRGDGIVLAPERSAVVSVIVRHVAGRGIALQSGGDIVNALVFDTGGDAQVVTGAGAYRVVNSTFAYHNRGGERSYAAAFGLDTTEDAVDVWVLNCLFYEQAGPIYFASRATARIENNLFWGLPDTLVAWGVWQWGEDHLDAMGPGNLVDDPLLVDPQRGDFHPGVGSPLFAAGEAFPETPSADLLAVPRVESITIGAFQTTRAGVKHSAQTTSTTEP